MSSLFFLFFAFLICIESLRLPLGSLGEPGPGFFPLGIGIVLGVLSVVAFFQARLSKARELRKSWYAETIKKNVILSLIALFAFSVFLEMLGFLLCTFLFLIILFRGMQAKPWIIAVGQSIIICLSCYVLFELLLKSQLPKGFLGF